MARFRALVEIVLACAALVGVGLSWLHGRHIVAVGPITDGQPSTTSLVYDPQVLLLAMLLAMIAGVLAVLGIARLLRARSAVTPSS
ncbi:membrane protein [Mycobacterium stomatepiae]|uniref:Membrane protein n=2 Tax=Mycobacterium stomatepiae TaxID=470076 RepID=A0A7I7Q9F5_9MYCO|nr:membrane protein [Mycobacterium stomatepiae]